VTCTNLSIGSSGRLTIGAQSTLIRDTQDMVMDGGHITMGSNSTLPGLTGNVIVKNGGSATLGLQGTALNGNQIAVTNGGNLNLYLSALDSASIMAHGTGTKDTGNIRFYFVPTVDSGSLVVTNGGSVAIWAPATNLPGTNYATLVTVQGDVTIATNSWVYPWAGNRSTDTARTVYMRAANIAIAAGGGIDANGRGYESARGPGKGGASNSRGTGGGHGGAGAKVSDGTGTGGITNGIALVPIDAGSGGGEAQALQYDANGDRIPNGYGGGAVRLEATGAVTLDGTITANGNAHGFWGGGGAGGTIYIKSGTFAGAATGRMTAQGRSGHGNGPWGGGGGGGRIAVWRAKHAYAGEPSVTDWANSVTSVVTLVGSLPGDIGTVEWVDIPPAGTMIMIR